MMRLTVLVDNSPGIGLRHEHGLSLHVETNGTSLLFDLGQTSRFAQNAWRLGMDLSAVALAVISHGHYDHGGGLGCFLEINRTAPVYLRRGADGPFHGGNGTRHIGLDGGVLAAHRERVRWLDVDETVAPGIHLIVRIPRIEPRPAGNLRLMAMRGDDLVQDDFAHELFCVVEEGDGVTVITGCGHSGIANMLLATRELFPGHTLKAVVGGFHLMGREHDGPAVDREGVEALMRALAGQGQAMVITGHCTGEGAMALLRERLGDRLVRMNTGMITEL
jgi:7,8-dihydropterin-6-yl-methyl-4-(beta-D-ribofuranosyl)aminobenzene 5'-phosphate synthase